MPSRWTYLVLAASAVFLGVGLIVARAPRAEPPLPVYGHVPVFQLVDEHGAPFGTGAMLGHVTVVDFVYTRCTASCPRLTAQMAALQSRLEEAKSSVRLVSFSVDPEHDTPEVLAAYAARFHADLARWSFLTGPVDAVQKAVVSGFKIAASKKAASKKASGANDYEVIHGDWFILVDPRGDIRGYFTASGPGDLAVLMKAIVQLESHG
ncbi:MAG: SCO family protein [Polyangiaceae bacterium]